MNILISTEHTTKDVSFWVNYHRTETDVFEAKVVAPVGIHFVWGYLLSTFYWG